MIHVDKRAGSIELYAPLQARGMATELTMLPFGDCCFTGHGPGGHDVLVGIERKTIPDLIRSMTDGRLSGHQLPGLVEMYAYRWVLVEGVWREGDDGLIELPRGGSWETVRTRYDAVEHYLMTLELRGGIGVHRTRSIRESAAWVSLVYQWWTGKTWAEHRSHLALHQPTEAALWTRPNLVHRMAAQLPGIDTKAAAVAQCFPTVTDMVLSEERTWTTIPGIGKITARNVVRAMRESS